MGGRGSSSSNSRSKIIDYSSRLQYIPEWLLQRKFNERQMYAINIARIEENEKIIKETEKAILVKYKSDFGNLNVWVPKSLLSNEAIEKSKREANIRNQKIQNGIEYNRQLLQLAKDNNIQGVRKGMKTQTLINKLRQKRNYHT